MSGSVLFYVQYLLGIGHLQRALLIADALAREGVAVTLVSGGEPVAALRATMAHRIVQLAPVHARDAGFALVDSQGAPLSDAVRQKRRTALLAAFAEARPDAVVIEGFPFARRAFRFELDPLIAAARAARPRPRLVASIRDILVMRDDPQRRRETVERVRADFDAVLVHGDPRFIRLDASFPAAPAIADRLVYTGYVAAPDPPEPVACGEHRAEILVSAGGGAVGHRLLLTALAARRADCLADRPWRLIAGINLPQADFAALGRDLPDNVAVERHRQDFRQRLRRCYLSVSQAGYNTVLDILAAKIPAVLVPFATGQETEQHRRAERLAARGVVELVAGAELTAERLAAAMLRAAGRPPRPISLDTDGARCSARFIARMIRANRGGPRGYCVAPEQR